MSESSFVLEDLKKQMIVRHCKILESIHVHVHHVFFTAKFPPIKSKEVFWKSWYHLFRFGSKAFDYVVGLLK